MISSNLIKTMLDTIRGSINYNSHPKVKENNMAVRIGLDNLKDDELIRLVREIENHQCRFIQDQMKAGIDKIKVPSIGNFVDIAAERIVKNAYKLNSNG